MTRMHMCWHTYAHSNVHIYAGFCEIFDPQPLPRPQNLQVGLGSYLIAVHTTAVYWYLPAPESSLGSLVGRCTMGCLAVIGTHGIREEALHAVNAALSRGRGGGLGCMLGYGTDGVLLLV
jgi:hypothetical protein